MSVIEKCSLFPVKWIFRKKRLAGSWIKKIPAGAAPLVDKVMCNAYSRQVIGDDQPGAVGCCGVAAEEVDIIRAIVAIILFVEAQAQLCHAELVDVLEIGGRQVEGVPVAG